MGRQGGVLGTQALEHGIQPALLMRQTQLCKVIIMVNMVTAGTSLPACWAHLNWATAASSHSGMSSLKLCGNICTQFNTVAGYNLSQCTKF